MADYPTLAEIVATHADSWIGENRHPHYGITEPGFRSCSCGQWMDDNPGAQFSRSSFGDHVQAEWVKARTIETVADLDALPELSVVRDRVGTVWEREAHGSPGSPWWRTGDERNRSAEWVKLPASLLFNPERDS